MKNIYIDEKWCREKISTSDDGLMKMKIQVASFIILKVEDYNQTTAAVLCGITQPAMSDVVNGHLERFTIDKLVKIAKRLILIVNFEIR